MYPTSLSLISLSLPFPHLSLYIYIYIHTSLILFSHLPSSFVSLPFHLSISVTTVAIHIQLVSGVLILSEPDGAVRRLRVPQLWPPDTGPCRSSALLTDILDSCRQGALHRLIPLFCRVFVLFYFVFLLLSLVSSPSCMRKHWLNIKYKAHNGASCLSMKLESPTLLFSSSSLRHLSIPICSV